MYSFWMLLGTHLGVIMLLETRGSLFFLYFFFNFYDGDEDCGGGDRRAKE